MPKSLRLPVLSGFSRTKLVWTLAIVLSSQQAHAATAYWDADGIVNGTYGGNGNWDTSSALWGTAADGTGTDHAWATGDTATFLRNTTANVTVSPAASALALNFGASGGAFTTGAGTYSLTGSALTLTQVASSNAITVASGSTATIANQVNISAGVRMDLTGGGTLNLDSLNATSNATVLFFGNASSEFNLGSITKGGSVTFGVQIGGSSGSNAAQYNFNGSNAMNGTFTVNKGIVEANHNSALGSGSAISLSGSTASAESQIVLIGTSGVTISRGFSFATGANSTGDTRTIGSNISSGTATFSGGIAMAETGANLRADTGGTTVFSGVISDGTETRGVTKIGGGIVKLTAINTYDGTTTVSAGTLLINNAQSGAGGVSVSSTGRFGGTGSVVGNVSIAAGGSFSPGDMDTLGVSGAESFGAASFTLSSNDITASMLFDLGATADSLNLSGAFTKGTGADFIFNFENSGGLTATTYTLVTFGSTNFLASDFDYTSSIPGLSGNFILDGDSLDFQVTAVPEPTAAHMLALAFASMCLIRRRRSAALASSPAGAA